ncbi:putative bifunctional diguanylate cyclase/phosphodiesterase [Sphingomonas sp. BAUL-RG-20F-R05-02]|uniref:putative bifunctional diguanylate cyclase/phosphodiesterase n=1 Tax=Sphingomonas sp. BAUL-RG-20F-R05-02 TaxID=2914830 RepID=UPI001F5781EB|nr:EAL domain-containing protein [Sphingomonas sp. BAUL-RG-20F-R05-02]
MGALLRKALRMTRFWAAMVRHRLKLLDGSVLAVVTALVAFYCFEVDVFETEGEGAPPITTNEVLLIAALFCAGLVIFALRRLAEAKRETKRRIVAEQEARNLALHDALTGLPNRRAFDDALAIAVASPPSLDAAHILLMMDLNGFKRINDVYGHGVGDEVLLHVGGRLARIIRGGDVVARLGGDEFAILATHAAGVEAATGLAQRVMDALEVPVSAGGTEHRVGVAIGIALTPQDGMDAAELRNKADKALYRAKEEKHRSPSAARFFEEGMDAQARERDTLERELCLAISERTVRPFYQPLVSLDGNRIIGFEALARWTSPTLGEVKPERFIAVAEDTGFITDLTQLLLEQACHQAATWPSDVTLSFNISGFVLQDPLFGLTVLKILTDAKLLPQRLELEITESALVRDLDAAVRALDQLRGMGVRIALDDFGTGYSSLYHLRVFRPDKIKIDRSFVDEIERDAGSAAIVRGLIGLGSGLGAQITAEGVETQAQRNLLWAHGCDQGQGFLFGEALAAEETHRLISAEYHLQRSTLKREEATG